MISPVIVTNKAIVFRYHGIVIGGVNIIGIL